MRSLARPSRPAASQPSAAVVTSRAAAAGRVALALASAASGCLARPDPFAASGAGGVPDRAAPQASDAMELVASAARPRSAANGCLGVGDSPTCVAAPPGPGGAAQPNLEGAPLATCSLAPRTGWFRDGTCATDERDAGVHVVCAEVTAAFLAFSRDRGNDLMTPVPSAAFPGLQPGDRWCLCAARWEEARVAGVAPPVIVEATHARAAELVDPAELRAHARDQP